ncbi:uncharacterized [Tachysurus ichikawai]
MRARGFSGSDYRLRHILTEQVLHEMRRWVSEIQEQVLFIGSRAGAETPEHAKCRARTTSPYTHQTSLDKSLWYGRNLGIFGAAMATIHGRGRQSKAHSTIY